MKVRNLEECLQALTGLVEMSNIMPGFELMPELRAEMKSVIDNLKDPDATEKARELVHRLERKIRGFVYFSVTDKHTDGAKMSAFFTKKIAERSGMEKGLRNKLLAQVGSLTRLVNEKVSIADLVAGYCETHRLMKELDAEQARLNAAPKPSKLRQQEAEAAAATKRNAERRAAAISASAKKLQEVAAL